MGGLFLIEIFKVVFIIIGTFVGAGFASGKEIYLFFYRYGIYGLIGMFISSFIIGFIAYKAISICKRNDIYNYDDFLDVVIENNNIKMVIRNVINIFLLVSFCLMISGFCSFMKQEFNINNILSYVFIMFICICMFSKDVNAIMKLNDFLMPIIILSVLFFYVNMHGESTYINNVVLNQGITNNFLMSCILYSNYNLLSIIPIGVATSGIIKNNKSIKKICITSGTIILLLSASIFYVLNTNSIGVLMLDMPVVAIVGQYGKLYKIYYCFIIGIAIMTTALSVGYGYLQKFKHNGKKYKRSVIVLILCTLLSIRIGFAKLVEILYPIFGCIGLIQSYLIIKSNTNK